MVHDGFVEMLRMMGVDPDSQEFTEAPEGGVATFFRLTRGYDSDPAEILDDIGAECSTPTRWEVKMNTVTLCARCMTPWEGALWLVVTAAAGCADTGSDTLQRLTSALAARLQTPGTLADQLAAAPVDLSDATRAEATVMVTRGCCCPETPTTARSIRGEEA